MDLGLTDKIALVTGASNGIGAATARLFAEEGADVIVSYFRDEAGAAGTAEFIRNRGRRSWLCRMDISQPAEVATAMSRLRSLVTGIDVLILCAGHNAITPFEQLQPDDWNDLIQVNLNGPFYVLQAVLPLLSERASVVTIASVAAHTGAVHHAHYAAAKAGLVNLTKSAARALAPRVRVNCVAPGITLTPMGRETIQALPADYAQSKILAQRFATPEEIARCIVFVASPAADFITGATLDINGGRDLR
ncbi:MAG: SDR family NAD(P)-dependent oxidoreductase [Acidobacteriota bacterium]